MGGSRRRPRPATLPTPWRRGRRFLAAGHYAPIASAVADALGTCDSALLDIGCGEGYYLSQISAAERYGLDIAKSAVQMAARLLPDAQFVVANAYRTPVLDHSVAAVTSVFSPHPFEEFARVLRPGGRWVTATPGPDHLRQLRPPTSEATTPKAIERFERRTRPPDQADTARRVQFELHLTAAAVADLYFMTPLRWQAGATGLESADDRTITVDVWVATGVMV